MKRNVWWQLLGSVWSILVVLHAPPTLAQPDSQSNSLGVICLTERPVIVEGERTTLQAWATTQDSQPPAQPVSFTWQVTEGTVQGIGAVVEWELSKVKVEPNELRNELRKKVTATVKAVATGVGEAGCRVEVLIGTGPVGHVEIPRGAEPPPAKLITGRGYLLPEEHEKLDYGFYSYLLFSAKPLNQEESARCQGSSKCPQLWSSKIPHPVRLSLTLLRLVPVQL